MQGFFRKFLQELIHFRHLKFTKLPWYLRQQPWSKLYAGSFCRQYSGDHICRLWFRILWEQLLMWHPYGKPYYHYICLQAQTVRNFAVIQFTLFRTLLTSNGIKISLLVQKLQQFCLINWICPIDGGESERVCDQYGYTIFSFFSFLIDKNIFT